MDETGCVEMKFSIIVPVYNTSKYLRKCLDSVLTQSYTDYEVLVVDDGSKDESLAICNEYSIQNSRIKVIHQDNYGLSCARNTGIECATGDYYCFLDSDDFWADCNFLNKVSQRLNETQSEVLVFNYCKVYENGKRTAGMLNNPETIGCECENSLLYMVTNGLWTACAWNKVIKKELFSDNKLQFRIGVTSEDIDWCVRLALTASTFDYLNCIGVCYLQRSTSISNAITYKKVMCLNDNIITAISFIDADNTQYANCLYPYIAYLVGTLIYSAAQLSDKNECTGMFKHIVPLINWLKYSNSNKIRLLRVAIKVCGIHGTIFLLRLKASINKIKMKIW